MLREVEQRCGEVQESRTRRGRHGMNRPQRQTSKRTESLTLEGGLGTLIANASALRLDVGE